MRKYFLIISALVLTVALMGFSSALNYNDSQSSTNMIVKANVLGPTISISVPDNLDFGNIAPGYISSLQNFSVTNSGTTNIEVTPQLENKSSANLFSNLFFKRIQSDNLTKIGLFNLKIDKPSVAGSEKIQNAYMQLDLTNYAGDISGNVNTTIIFTAVPSS